MKLIQGLTDQTKQQMTLVLDDGTRATWYLEFKPQQKGWFYSVIWGSRTVNGQRLVASPNILRQFINVIPFGILIQTTNNLDPVQQGSFVDGSTRAILLQGSDLSAVETAAYDAPVAELAPIDASAEGSVPILPSSWGPAGGDLTKTYPSPWVRAFHTGTDTPEQLVFGSVEDGGFLRRVGSEILSDTLSAGDVIGPDSSGDGNLAVFDGTSGKRLKDGGSLDDGSLDLVVASTVASIMEAIRYNFPQAEVGPSSGTISLDLSANNRAYVQIDNNCTFNFTTPVNSQLYWLTIKNTAGSAKTVAWPGVTVANGATLPVSIDAGATVSVLLNVIAGSTAGIVVIYSGAGLINPMTTLGDTLYGGAGGVATRIAGSTTSRRKFFAQTGTGTISAAPVWAKADIYNVIDYGADPTGAADSWAAFAAAISDGLATGKGFCLYAPAGWYKVTKQIGITVTNGIAFSLKGDGIGVSQLVFTDTSGDAGIIFTRTGDGGTYDTNTPSTWTDFNLVSSGNNNADALTITRSAGSSDPAEQGHRISRVSTQVSTVDDSSHRWRKGIVLFNSPNVMVDHCKIGAIDSGVYISGDTTDANTSVFWIDSCDFQMSGIGIKVDGTGGLDNRIEGVFSRGNSFVGVSYALWWENSNTGGALEVTGGQINCTGAGAGIHVKGVTGIVIGNIPSFNTSDFTGDWNAVEILDDCWESSIYSCIFGGGSGTGTRKGIYIQPSSGSDPIGRRNVAANCSFAGFDTNVEFGSHVSYSKCFGHVCDGGAWVDSGSNNVMGDALSITDTVTLSGSGTEEDFNVDVTPGFYGVKPGGEVQLIDGTSFQTYDSCFRWTDGGTTKTNAVIRVFKRGGGTLGSETLRFMAGFTPEKA